MAIQLDLHASKIELFHVLHHEPAILILPNAWDALSAKLFEKAGAKAIGPGVYFRANRG